MACRMVGLTGMSDATKDRPLGEGIEYEQGKREVERVVRIASRRGLVVYRRLVPRDST